MDSALYDTTPKHEVSQEVKDRVEEERKLRNKRRKQKPNRRRLSDDAPDVMDIGKVRKVEKSEHWTTTLNKMKRRNRSADKSNDNINYVSPEALYTLNVNPSSAWNKNPVNSIQLRGTTAKEIVTDILDEM